ncbi:MAG: hypothetical protein MZU95_14395 [Desulfomicrobium escambiense]|nr:hypothetical protein [Desulfomicrobium escambiense]
MKDASTTAGSATPTTGFPGLYSVYKINRQASIITQPANQAHLNKEHFFSVQGILQLGGQVLPGEVHSFVHTGLFHFGQSDKVVNPSLVTDQDRAGIAIVLLELAPGEYFLLTCQFLSVKGLIEKLPRPTRVYMATILTPLLFAWMMMAVQRDWLRSKTQPRINPKINAIPATAMSPCTMPKIAELAIRLTLIRHRVRIVVVQQTTEVCFFSNRD